MGAALTGIGSAAFAADGVPRTDSVPQYSQFLPISDPGTGNSSYFQPYWYAKDSDGATTGHHIQAHGGQVLTLTENGQTVYYWYGEDRSNGYDNSPGVHVYRSIDGMNWTDRGLAMRSVRSLTELTSDPYFTNLYGVVNDGVVDTAKAEKLNYYLNVNPDQNGDGTTDSVQAIFERPKVLYNAAHNNYVMWWHSDGSITPGGSNYARSLAAVAVSDSPVGPFKMVGAFRMPNRADYKTGHASAVPGGARDMTVFQDSDGTAYIVYSSEENRTLYVSKLNDDYTNAAQSTNDPAKIQDFAVQYSENGQYPYTLADGGAGAPVEHQDYTIVKDRGSLEAPAIFVYNGVYYIVASGATGWSPNKQTYYTADAVNGTWIRGVVPNDEYENTAFNSLPEGADGLLSHGDSRGTSFGSQSTAVFELSPGKFIYMGDRWDAGKADSTYVWLPMTIANDGTLEMRNPAQQNPAQWGSGWDLSYWNQEDSPLALASLTINGTLVSGFSPNTLDYAMNIGAWGAVPTVAAVAADENGATITTDVSTTRATITVTSKDDPTQRRVYTVRFSFSSGTAGCMAAVSAPWKTTSWGTAATFCQGVKPGSFRVSDPSNTGAWTNKDNLSLVWQPAALDVGGSIETSLTSSEMGGNSDPRAGIIIRNDLSPSGKASAHGYALLVAGVNGTFFQTDTNNNGYIDKESAKAATASTSLDRPLYLKLTRLSLTQVEGFYRMNPMDAWTSVGTATISSDANAALDVGVFAVANNQAGTGSVR